MEIVYCPSCGQPAEIVWRTHLFSTDGPIEHVSVRCLIGHVFLMPAAGLAGEYGRLLGEDAPSHELHSEANRAARAGEPLWRQTR